MRPLGRLVLANAMLGFGLGPLSHGLSAQDRDVELLGEIYGTRPPDAYYELKARDPGAFRMERGMAAGRGMPANGLRLGAGLSGATLVIPCTETAHLNPPTRTYGLSLSKPHPEPVEG